ncbi:MAG TPA: alcohol dehydrogenase catalytic domain-containing protein, partial [Streptosporangiaceae bacterium]|nr:alcohol dehydrogenase catalytic domain-containing protein [Streptosporangiaceae bacterium]
MASLMRALIIDGTKSASVQHVPVPVPGPHQAVVDVHRVGVCGTDVELFTRELPYFEQGKSRFPLCPGH